jgi:beta-glucosidase/6-phospho-beta-glucosidase/beta-galactosidase
MSSSEVRECTLNCRGASLNQFSVTPWGLQGLLEYFKQAYGNPPIYIYENGLSLSLSLSHKHIIDTKTHANAHTQTPIICKYELFLLFFW